VVICLKSLSCCCKANRCLSRLGCHQNDLLCVGWDVQPCLLAGPPQCGASYSNGPRCLSVCLPHANISEITVGEVDV